MKIGAEGDEAPRADEPGSTAAVAPRASVDSTASGRIVAGDASSLTRPEDVYRIVAESACDWELLVDCDRRVVYSSPSCRRIAGHAPSEFVDDPELLVEIVHPQDREAFLRHREHAEHGESSGQFEYRIVLADRGTVWIGHACQPVFGSTGERVATRVTNRDITDRKRLDLETQAASRYARSLIEASLDPLVTISPEGMITDVNEATLHATGVARDALVGTDFAEYFTAPELARAGHRRVLDEGFVRDYPLTLRHASGRTIDVLYNASVFRNDAGAVQGVFAAARDVTDRRRAEAARARLAAIVESSGDAIIGKTLEGTISTWNKGAEQIYGWTAEEIVGQPISKLAPPERRDEVLSLLDRVRRGEGIAPYETVRVRKDGRRFDAAVTLSPMKDASGAIVGVSTIARDISDRKRLEEAIRKREADLKDAQRLASLGSWSWDATTDAGTWSEEMYRIFDRDPSLPALGYQEYLAHCTPQSAAALRAVVEDSMRAGVPYEIDLEVTTPSGARRWVTERGEPVRDERGGIVGLRGTTQDITARKWAEEQLRRASAYARSLIEASLDPLVTISPEGKITDVNEATERATGVSRADLVGTDFADYFTEPERARDGYRQVLERGFVRDYPLTIRNPLGRDVDVHYNASVYRDDAGALAGVFAAARDVTDRKRALEALERERDFNVAVLGTVASLVLVLDLDGRIVVFNKACEECTGWALAEVVGRPFFDLFVPEREREAVRGVWRQLATTALPSRFENHWLTRRGDERLVEFANATLKKPDGSVEFVISAGTDVTDRRRAEAELRESEARLKEAQRIAHIGNWEVDAPRGTLVWSEEVFRIFELDPRSFVATYEAFLEALHPEDRALVDRAFRESVERHVPYDLVHRVRLKDGRIKFVNARGETIYDADGKPLRSLGTVQDITDRKRAEDALQQLNAELEERVHKRTSELEAANKELEGFSYSVSHDLRSPLRAIDGFSRIVMTNYGDKLDDEGKRLLGIVRENTARMGRLIDDILAFSRAGRLELRGAEVDLAALVNDVWQELEPARDGRDVRLAVGALPRVRGDAAMLRQVLANLLGNAVKFTSKKPIAHVEIGATIEGDMASFFVKDDGVGFDPQYVHKLFGVFQRLHGIDEFEGTGIGLAIVKRIVTRHGGTVRAEGQVDEGATIRFTLPLAGG